MTTPDLAHLLEHLEVLCYGVYRVKCVSRHGTPLEKREFVVHGPLEQVWDRQAGEFVYDPLPSNRTPEHQERTRFPFLEAVELAQKFHQGDSTSRWLTGDDS